MHWNLLLCERKDGAILTVEELISDVCREIAEGEGWKIPDDLIQVRDDNRTYYYSPDTELSYLVNVFCEDGYLIIEEEKILTFEHEIDEEEGLVEDEEYSSVYRYTQKEIER